MLKIDFIQHVIVILALVIFSTGGEDVNNILEGSYSDTFTHAHLSVLVMSSHLELRSSHKKKLKVPISFKYAHAGIGDKMDKLAIAKKGRTVFHEILHAQNCMSLRKWVL